MIKPHRTVPHVPWTASHHWDLGVKRLFTLIFGLSIFGIGEALIVQGNLGNSPWVVFADGLSRHTPLNIGWSTFVTSAVVLALWIPLKEKPGFGTLANIAVIAYFLQVGVDFIPKTHNIYIGLVMTFGGIAIVGLGNIGSEVYRHLTKNKNFIEKNTNSTFQIKYISARTANKKRGFSIPRKMWVKNPLSLPKKDDVDIIIELIGGPDGVAKKLAFSALKNNKHFITANKALIFKHGNELARIAEKNSVNLLFEASVGGGIPIIKSIKESLVGNKLFHIYGILT